MAVSNPNGVNLHGYSSSFLGVNSSMVSNPNGVNLHTTMTGIAKDWHSFKPQRGKFTLFELMSDLFF